jgi:hypothetical protein
MHGGTDVVAEAGQRQLGRARAAANRLLRFEDQYRPAGLGERDCGGEPVGPGSDDDRV